MKRYKVNGHKKIFKNLQSAIDCANAIYKRTGIIVSVEEVNL